MRVVSFSPDDPLADAVVDHQVDFTVDDIATPGSFWLNPPHPRDDKGNRVDPYAVANAGDDGTDDGTVGGSFVANADDNDELRWILADLDPL